MKLGGVTQALVALALATGALYLLLPILSVLAGPALATTLGIAGVTAVYAVTACDRQGLPRRRAFWPLVAGSAIAVAMPTPASALVPVLAALAFVRSRPSVRTPLAVCALRELGLVGAGLLVAASLHSGTRESLCLAIWAFCLIQLLGETLLGPGGSVATRDPFEQAHRRVERRLGVS